MKVLLKKGRSQTVLLFDLVFYNACPKTHFQEREMTRRYCWMPPSLHEMTAAVVPDDNSDDPSASAITASTRGFSVALVTHTHFVISFLGVATLTCSIRCGKHRLFKALQRCDNGS